MRTASPKPFSVISQVMVAPESLIRSIYRLRVFQNKVLGRISGTKKELVKEGWSALHNEQRGSFKSLLKHISVLKWTGGGDWWDLWQAWRSSEMSSGFTLTHSLTQSLTSWLYGPLRALVNLITKARPSISTALYRHFLPFITHRSFSTTSSHLSLGLPLTQLPSDLLSNIFLTVLPWSILATCPIHSNLFYLISVIMYISGHAVAQLVEALRYKSEGRGFDSRWCRLKNFPLT